jgi:hypothetical protein
LSAAATAAAAACQITGTKAELILRLPAAFSVHGPNKWPYTKLPLPPPLLLLLLLLLFFVR